MEPLDPELRAFVRRAMIEAVPDRAAEARVEARLLARIGAPSPDPSGEQAPHPAPCGAEAATAGVGATKVLAVVLAIGAGAIGTGLLRPRDRTTVAPPRVDARAPVEAKVPASAPHERAPVSSTTDPPAPATAIDPTASAPPSSSPGVLETRRSQARTRPRPPSSPQPAVAVPAVEGDLAAELRLIRAAWEALEATHTTDALELARRHAREHASGQLGPEREAIEAIARCRDGNAAAAEVFIARHARTKLAEKVRNHCAELTDSHDDGTVRP